MMYDLLFTALFLGTREPQKRYLVHIAMKRKKNIRKKIKDNLEQCNLGNCDTFADIKLWMVRKYRNRTVGDLRKTHIKGVKESWIN